MLFIGDQGADGQDRHFIWNDAPEHAPSSDAPDLIRRCAIHLRGVINSPLIATMTLPGRTFAATQRAAAAPNRRRAQHSDLGHVDLASGFVRAGDHEQPAERDILTDHHRQLGDLRVAEVRAQFSLERRVHGAEVAGELLSQAYGERVTWRKRPLGLWQVDLGNGCFIEPLPRRRRVPREESRITLIERCDFQTCQLLDARWHDTVVVAGPEEIEVTREQIRDQPRQIEAIVGGASAATVLCHQCLLGSSNRRSG